MFVRNAIAFVCDAAEVNTWGASKKGIALKSKNNVNRSDVSEQVYKLGNSAMVAKNYSPNPHKKIYM